MIDPLNPPHISAATDAELQEFLLFSIAVAGKHAGRTATSLASWLADDLCGWRWMAGKGSFPKNVEDFTPFDKIGYYTHRYTIYSSNGNVPMYHLAEDMLAGDLKRHGFGCFNQRAKSFIDLKKHRLNIRDASYDRLIKVYGIGIKTANFFLAYTGIDEDRVILDTHILKWLCGNGWPGIPDSTPNRYETYELIASYFRKEAHRRKLSLLDLDRQIWQANRR